MKLGGYSIKKMGEDRAQNTFCKARKWCRTVSKWGDYIFFKPENGAVYFTLLSLLFMERHLQ